MSTQTLFFKIVCKHVISFYEKIYYNATFSPVYTYVCVCLATYATHDEIRSSSFCFFSEQTSVVLLSLNTHLSKENPCLEKHQPGKAVHRFLITCKRKRNKERNVIHVVSVTSSSVPKK